MLRIIQGNPAAHELMCLQQSAVEGGCGSTYHAQRIAHCLCATRQKLVLSMRTEHTYNHAQPTAIHPPWTPVPRSWQPQPQRDCHLEA